MVSLAAVGMASRALEGQVQEGALELRGVGTRRQRPSASTISTSDVTGQGRRSRSDRPDTKCSHRSPPAIKAAAGEGEQALRQRGGALRTLWALDNEALDIGAALAEAGQRQAEICR